MPWEIISQVNWIIKRCQVLSSGVKIDLKTNSEVSNASKGSQIVFKTSKMYSRDSRANFSKFFQSLSNVLDGTWQVFQEHSSNLKYDQEFYMFCWCSNLSCHTKHTLRVNRGRCDGMTVYTDSYKFDSMPNAQRQHCNASRQNNTVRVSVRVWHVSRVILSHVAKTVSAPKSRSSKFPRGYMPHTRVANRPVVPQLLKSRCLQSRLLQGWRRKSLTLDWLQESQI